MNLNKYLKLADDIKHYTKWLKEVVKEYNKIIILGNGGSSAIASHISQDYTKILEKRSMTFSDPSMLTCYINDYGMEHAYSAFLEDFADTDTLVILISSSGKSLNTVNAAAYCVTNEIKYATLTGFEEENPLRETGEQIFDYWAESDDYGIVECLHLLLLHSIL